MIVINSSWRLAPWADVLFAADLRYWQAHRGVPEFRGRKYRVTSATKESRFPGVEALSIRRGHEHFIFDGDEVGDGGNSGFMATNLAIRWGGGRPIVLVGFDMDVPAHWHGPHAGGLANPRRTSIVKWRNRFNAQATELARRGLEVYRESAASTLFAFPVLSLRDALERFT